MKCLAYIAMVLIGAPSILFAQEGGTDVPDMTSDRPLRTESSATVPFGHVQFEAGAGLSVEETDSTRTTTYHAPGLLVRVGLSDDIELRVGGEFEAIHREALIVRDVAEGNSNAQEDVSGLGDILIGGKVRFITDEDLSPGVSFSSHLALPVGALGPDDVRLSDARVAVSKTFLDVLTIGTNVGVARNNGDALKGMYSAMAGVSLLDVVGVYAEAYGEAPWYANPEQSVGGGVSWSPVDIVQFDVAGGVGVTEAADDYQLNAGITVRVP